MSTIQKYILRDYTFLHDYVIIEQQQQELNSFIAKIRDTEQYVMFYKVPFHQQFFPRFQNLVQLFNQGIVLADNIFLLEEAGNLFFYVIEAYTQDVNSRFKTLHTKINEKPYEKENFKIILDKIKVLMDCLHQTGQPYVGLTSNRIIVDQEDNVFLSPFPLSYELKTDRYTSAYYSPQLLEDQIKRQSEKTIQSDKEMLIKNDIWAFGCIAMEIHSFCTPIFYSMNNLTQFEAIKQFSLNPKDLCHFEGEERLVSNLIFNCLELNQQNRIMSSERDEFTHEMRQKMINREPIKTGNGDCQFQFHCICLSGLQIDKEIRINIYLDKQYSFFASKDDRHPRKALFEVDRRIILKASFEDLYRLLNEPLLVELIENEKRTKIRVNLSTLVFIVDQKRTWDKPLIGSYSAKGKGDYPSAKIKLNCSVKTPAKQKFDLIQLQKTVGNYETQNYQYQDKNQKKNKKANALSAININLSELAMKWKERAETAERQETNERHLSQKVKKILLRN